jgi:hypothetical protein
VFLLIEKLRSDAAFFLCFDFEDTEPFYDVPNTGHLNHSQVCQPASSYTRVQDNNQ